MKNLTKLLVVVAGIATFAATTGLAQPYSNETWNVDENGPALLQGGQLVGYSNGTNKFDPISGLVGWYYPLGAQSTPGDVVLLESTNGASDLLRFDGQGVFFFSDLEPGEVNPDHADVPVLPPWNTTNYVILNEVGPEGNNGALYVPSQGLPGYDLSGLFPGLKYNIISDSPVVPEPNTVAVAMTGGVLLLNSMRRRGRRAKTRPVNHGWQDKHG